MRYLSLIALLGQPFFVAGMAVDTVSLSTAFMMRIDSLKLLPDGSLADKNILDDMSSLFQKYLHRYDHERLKGILAEDSQVEASALKVFRSCMALEYQYEKARINGLFGSIEGEKQYLSAQAPIAYEVYIALLKKIAHLKEALGSVEKSIPVPVLEKNSSSLS
jgi:hypothetical protein